MGQVPRIVVMASGEGTNFQRIVDSISDGSLKARIIALISNRPDCGAVRRAKEYGIPSYHFSWKSESDSNFSNLSSHLLNLKPDLIVLAGFMRILPPEIISVFKMKIINTHPSLLPCFGGMNFYGEKVHSAVIDSGAKFSGCTTHFVTGEVDGGPIISQAVVPVLDSDSPQSLAERVKEVEHQNLISSVKLVLSGNFRVAGKRVVRL
jgi:phosphoribosylglycinamide formyltransferase-1